VYSVDDSRVNGRRVVLAATFVAVAVLAGLFTVLRWDVANKVATAVSALAGVAAAGIAVWAALPAFSGGSGVRVSRTGRATAGHGGTANSGVTGPAGSPAGPVRADRTGDADANGGGDANTGVRLD
jgi:hypothetical protein